MLERLKQELLKLECIYRENLEKLGHFELKDIFTFLSPHTHEEIYWEHHGMMDNPNYLKNTLKKIQTYEANGIFRGENLIITYESSNHVLNLEWVMQLVEKYLIKGD